MAARPARLSCAHPVVRGDNGGLENAEAACGAAWARNRWMAGPCSSHTCRKSKQDWHADSPADGNGRPIRRTEANLWRLSAAAMNGHFGDPLSQLSFCPSCTRHGCTGAARHCRTVHDGIARHRSAAEREFAQAFCRGPPLHVRPARQRAVTSFFPRPPTNEWQC
jgi:hypothetical protein